MKTKNHSTNEQSKITRLEEENNCQYLAETVEKLINTGNIYYRNKLANCKNDIKKQTDKSQQRHAPHL